ncbi:MAG: hypothetical protein Q9210_007104 [Variospora velana]
MPEYNAPFCDRLARTTGIVVVSITYRFAPRCTFPAAHDDVDDIFVWLLEHAEEEFNADPTLLTVSGLSAGANLALAASLKAKNKSGGSSVLDAVTFYALDARMNPTFAPLQDLPKEMLFVIPTIDILLHEQLQMIDRLQQEIKTTQQRAERRVEKAMFEGRLHGWDQRAYNPLDAESLEESEDKFI